MIEKIICWLKGNFWDNRRVDTHSFTQTGGGKRSITGILALLAGYLSGGHPLLLHAQSILGEQPATAQSEAVQVAKIPAGSAWTQEPLGPCSRCTGLVISEIMYHPLARGDSLNVEYLEIFNSQSIPENLGGYRITGDIDFTFPADAILPAGAFLVVGKVPEDIKGVYGITNVMGPYAGNLKAPGQIRLRNRSDAILLEVDYANQSPWPVAPDGAGHSLILARPSMGEGNPAAWSASYLVGGSPGRAETTMADSLRAVVINEFLAHTDPPLWDYIELYNHSAQPVDISGCSLSDDPNTNRFILPPDTIIPAGGFLSFESPQLGFNLRAAGETIYLKNPEDTCVLDAVTFEAQENGVSTGRFPDGAGEFYRLVARTPGAPNSDIMPSPVVINEIMYHPPLGQDDGQFVELHNRSSREVDLSRWRFTAGIDFTFPVAATIAPGGYLVVARNVSWLRTNYPGLDPDITLGDFGGRLASVGERLALAMPCPEAITNLDGVVTTNWLEVVVDEVTYGTGGRWGKWADGGGSSLELRDPRANHRLAANWADSDETAKSSWMTVEHTGVMDNGRADYPVALQLFLEEEGECLVDNVEVIGPGGTNLVANATFESGANGWVMQGTHDLSTGEYGTGYGGGNCLHVRASGRGDTGVNLIRTALLANQTLVSGTRVTLRAKVRWLKGCPGILFRLRGNWLEAPGDLVIPGNLGTPGAANSRIVSNSGPAIFAVSHAPVLPAANKSVKVTAQVQDADSIGQVTLNYRVDPNLTFTSIPLVDDGSDGDEVAGDGVFTATIPGQTSGKLAAFYIRAMDKATTPAVSTFPANVPERECLVRFGETQPAGDYPVYRVWITQATAAAWGNRLKLHNGPLDATFVYGNRRAVYNIGVCYAGSPFIRPSYSGPMGAACGYSVEFPKDDLFLGITDMALDWPVRDNALQSEQVACWIAGELGIPFNLRRFVHLYVNGTRRGTIYEDAQRPNSDFLEEWMPDDTNGDLYKIDDWFEFADNAAAFFNVNATLQPFTTTGGAKKLARYRWSWRKRAADSANDYSNIFALVDALNSTGAEAYTANVERLVNVEEWMRTFCLEHMVGNWDSYGYERGKNMYAYKPRNGKWIMMTWDIDFVLASGGRAATSDMFVANDPTMTRMYNHPPFRRAYFRAMYDAVNGPLIAGKVNPLFDAHYAALLKNGISATAPTSDKSYIQSRRAYLTQLLNGVAANFAITSNNGKDFSAKTNLLQLTGTAPVQIKTLEVNGVPYPVAWTTVSNWTLRIPLASGTNYLTVRGIDSWGNLVTNAAPVIAVNYTEPMDPPQDHLVINEIMYHPSVADAEFIELLNTSVKTSYDLSGWRMDGASFTFPEGTIMAPGGLLVIAKNRAVFAATYGANIPVAGEFGGKLSHDGEKLSLVKPGVPPELDQIIAQVRYNQSVPWPENANGWGPSLQLVDPNLDIRRVANWASAATNAAVKYTPGAANSVKKSLEVFPSLWLNEVLPNNQSGQMDQAGSRGAWLELYNSGATAIDLGNYYLSDNYTNLTQWRFPANAMIEPSAFLLVWVDGRAEVSDARETHASFSLDPANGTVALSRLQGGMPAVLDYINYKYMRPDRSFGSYPDGHPLDRRPFDYPSPGTTNNPAWAPVQLFINEWMASNTQAFADPADNNFEDWFELYNADTNTVDLSAYWLSDDPSVPAKFEIPAGTIIGPKGYLLVWADNETGQNIPANRDLHANFKLNRAAGTISLCAPDGKEVDAVVWGLQTNDVSQGRYPDGAAAPFLFLPIPTPRMPNVVNLSNHPPVVFPIADQIVIEGQPVSFTVVARDLGVPAEALTFSLDPGAPEGAMIDPVSGQFSWMPTPAQIPATNLVAVRVAKGSSPALSATTVVRIITIKLNHAPVLEPIADASVEEGTLLNFAVFASDPDAPSLLTFALEFGAPNGATINPTNGVFSWLPDEAQGPSTNVITVRVTDNGYPALRATQSFKVVVKESNSTPSLPAIPNQVVRLGGTLDLKVTANDADLPPNKVVYTLDPGAPSGMTIDSASGVVSWTPSASHVSQAYTVSVNARDDGIPPLGSRQSFTVFVLPAWPWQYVSLTSNAPSSTLYVYLRTPGDLYLDDLMIVAGNQAGQGVNTVKNGDFESPLAGSWTVSANHADSAISTTVKHSGNGSLHVVASSGGTTRDSSIYQIISPALVQNNPYTLSFWYLPGTNITSLTIRFSGSGLTSVTTINPPADQPPLLAPIGDQVVQAGKTLSFLAPAADPNLPPLALRFSLDAGAPAGAAVDPDTGAFSWTPTLAQGPATNRIQLRVTQKTAPNLTAVQSFNIRVTKALAPAPRITNITVAPNGAITLAWTSEPGNRYQVQYMDNLGDLIWRDLGIGLTADGPTTSFSDQRGENSRRYYRIVLLGSP